VRRRNFLWLLGVTLAWRSAASAERNSGPVIGFLGFASPSGFADSLSAWREGLRESGYIDGQNVLIEYRWAEGDRERLSGFATELASRNVDVIFTSGGLLPTTAAKQATSRIPIVFEIGVDPVEKGLVSSYARPTGNLTGVTILTADLMPKRLELLSELIPKARVIGLVVNPSNAPDRMIRDVQSAASEKNVQVQVVNAASEDQFEPAFALLVNARADAILVGNDPFFYSHRENLVSLAARHAIPAVYEWRDFVVAGGLMSYGTSLRDMYRQAGGYVGRILSGAKPADLPVLQPTKFELVINLKTAKALGITVPQSLLQRADEIIE
jgi:ABC-type uncharacterized transport system substrate-binding protein